MNNAIQAQSAKPLPADYLHRVYAGVLGKVIGVYLGRPFEQWTHEAIVKRFGEIRSYVHEQSNVPLIVSDDDITGTFTFIRTLEDFAGREITAADFGKTWLNYIIENRAILWWGGMGRSSEHTAFNRLKAGIEAPLSGSIRMNGKIVAQQIGAQIFIDGCGLVAPGDPALAVELAGKAGSVAHDGEAVLAAKVIAAMEAQAFVEHDLNALIDTAISFIPSESMIYRLIEDLRKLRATSDDWHVGLKRIQDIYGYDKWLGGCHIVPNHAVLMLALLWGNGDFSESLMIANTAGYDTDCNSANVGCIMGIRGGLEAIGANWRDPVADRVLLPTADGGNCINDTTRLAVRIANMGRQLRSLEPLAPKDGSRFHFDLPGSVQGWMVEQGENLATGDVKNVLHPTEPTYRVLSIAYPAIESGRVLRVSTPTFPTQEQLKRGGYSIIASPMIYPGQQISAEVIADRSNAGLVHIQLLFNYYDRQGALHVLYGGQTQIEPGSSQTLRCVVPEAPGCPIQSIGIEVAGGNTKPGKIFIDRVRWSGIPSFTLEAAGAGLPAWQSWVNSTTGALNLDLQHLTQNVGRGLVVTGTRHWRDYQLAATFVPMMVKSFGIVGRMQGLERYIAIMLAPDNRLQLIRHLNGQDEVLAEKEYQWDAGQTCEMWLTIKDNHAQGGIGDVALATRDIGSDLTSGAVGVVIEEGHAMMMRFSIRPAK